MINTSLNNKVDAKLNITLFNNRGQIIHITRHGRIVKKIGVRKTVQYRLFKNNNDSINYIDEYIASLISKGGMISKIHSSGVDRGTELIDLRIEQIDVPEKCFTWNQYLKHVADIKQKEYDKKCDIYKNFDKLNYDDQKIHLIQIIEKSNLADEFREAGDLKLFCMEYFPGCSDFNTIFKKLISV